MLRRLWWLLPLALCAGVYAPTLTNGFLADDYTYLVSLGWWADDGELLQRVLRNFIAGIDAGSFYYRPLPIASFALNFLAGGADPVGWRSVNLVLHLACGALVAALAAGLAARLDARAALGAATAAAVFALSPAGPEVVAWVSGRFDSLALFFMLLALAGFQRSARWNDGYGIGGLAAAVCAFACKESATLTPVLVLALAAARPDAARDPRPAGTEMLAVAARAARQAAPWLLLLGAYFAWRIALFGTPFRVYPDTAEPVAALVRGNWLATLGSSAQWLRAEMPDPLARTAFGWAVAVALALGGAWCLAHRVHRPRWVALAGAVVVAIVLPVLQIRVLDPQGESGRLFYVAAAAFALLVALPWASPPEPGKAWMWNRAVRGAFIAAIVVAVAAEAVLLGAALTTWRRAGTQAAQLVAVLAQLPARIPADGYGFVLIPDRIGGVPFGRLAQGGFTLPPVQPASLLSRLVVQTERDLPAWPQNMRRGIVDALKRYPPREVWAAVAAGRATGADVPTDFFCWDDAGARLAVLPLRPPLSGEHWLPAWKAALAASPCRELSRALPDR
jgi:hypothetical protein